MLKMLLTNDARLPRAYRVFGCGSIDIVVEIGLGATAGEWWHIAERLAENHCVLLYERQRDTTTPRTPENIAQELHALLQKLGHSEKIVILAH